MTILDEPQLAVSVRRCQKTWRDHGYDVEQNWVAQGPAGFAFRLQKWDRQGSVIVSQAEHDGDEWIHASLAFADVMPTYGQMVILHQSVFGHRRWAYQVFAPVASHVNLHQYALHLFGRADGNPVLPDFTRGTGSI